MDESLTPERDSLWAKHDGLTPALAAEMIVLAGKIEMERNDLREIKRAALALKNAKGRHNSEIAARKLFDLL